MAREEGWLDDICKLHKRRSEWLHSWRVLRFPQPMKWRQKTRKEWFLNERLQTCRSLKTLKTLSGAINCCCCCYWGVRKYEVLTLSVLAHQLERACPHKRGMILKDKVQCDPIEVIAVKGISTVTQSKNKLLTAEINESCYPRHVEIDLYQYLYRQRLPNL